MAKKPTYEELQQRVKELEQAESGHQRMAVALRESEERYRQIFNIAPAGIYEVDFRSGRLVAANDAICEFSGYTRDELFDMNAIDLLTQDSKEKFLNRMSQLLDGDTIQDSVDYQIKRKDGSVRWVRISNRFIYGGENIIGATVVASDITERKRVEEELIKSEHKYKTLVNAAPFGIQLTDRRGKIIYSNPAHHAILGYADGELIDTYFWPLITNDENIARTREYYDYLIKNEPPPEVYYNLNKTKDGRIIDVQVNWDYIRNSNGKVDGIISIIQDITEKKQALKALEAHEKELENKSKNLMEMNAALNVLIKKMEKEEIQLQEKILANIQQLVFPYLRKIKRSNLDGSQQALLDIVQSNLNKITTDFSHQLSSIYYGLTSTEIKVADLVRQGKTTKEISDILTISNKTTESHRGNIRKKLGISGKRANLRAHLISMDNPSFK